MTAGEQRSMRWNTHEFVSTDLQDDAGRTCHGAFCPRCSMFAPVGSYFRMKPCQPIVSPATVTPIRS